MGQMTYKGNEWGDLTPFSKVGIAKPGGRTQLPSLTQAFRGVTIRGNLSR
jgi:hypothetical protein